MLRMIDLREQHDELVATVATNGIGGADSALQPQRDAPNQLIADGMPQRVVDGLEAVQIDEEHCDLVVTAMSQSDRLGDSIA
jgi:hypothetical protein